MLILLSPAKSLDFEPIQHMSRTQARMKAKAWELAQVMKTKNPQDLKKLMSISDKLADLNTARFKSFTKSHAGDQAKQAIFAFTGDVYVGLDAPSLTKKEVEFAQKHVRILSGLYGLLRPLDVIQPYRLEMGTKLETSQGNSLYEFWGEAITDLVNRDLQDSNEKYVLNLASKEYFRAIKPDQIKANIIDVDFREYRDGKLKFISFSAKKARGLLTRYVIKNRVKSPEKLKGFNYENYSFNSQESKADHFCFSR